MMQFWPPEIIEFVLKRIVKRGLENAVNKDKSGFIMLHYAEKYSQTTLANLFMVNKVWATILSNLTKLRPSLSLSKVLSGNIYMVENDVQNIIFWQSIGFNELPISGEQVMTIFGSLYTNALVREFVKQTSVAQTWVVDICIRDKDLTEEFIKSKYQPKFSEPHCRYAAKSGNLELLKKLRQLGCRWDWHVAFEAANNGDLEMLKYVKREGGSYGYLSEETPCYAAALNGHLECLKYAHETGCEWDERVPYAAASGNHLECLEFAYAHGCPWDGTTRQIAYERNHVECSQFAKKNGCPRMNTLIKGRRSVKKANCNCNFQFY